MPALVLGPMLRHTAETTAAVWVETDSPCTVDVLGTTVRTFEVRGHHYALVPVEGLHPGSSTPYQVRLDGETVWPDPGSDFPPSRIRTLDADRPVRLVFGSCRHSTPMAVGTAHSYDPDALDAYSRRLRDLPESRWPDLLMLLGDQVYADDTSEETQDFIRSRRDPSREPGLEVADFEEYTRLYLESWQDPDVRWLLSTVPSAMMFDDHDVRDDWNTSESWRREVEASPWWAERIQGGLASYWVYQHLGNLSPQARAEDAMWRRVLTMDGDTFPVLRGFAEQADEEADGGPGYRWSYRLDLGGVRVLALDTRCGRVLTEGSRSMLGEPEFAWVEDQATGGVDHLLVASSLPWLLPRAIHDMESWNEQLCAGARGPVVAAISERVRQLADLEHWAAMRGSFDRLARAVGAVARGERGTPPATVCVLSGDVHHAYVAEAWWPEPVASRVYQLTCSPVHHAVPQVMKAGFRAGWSTLAARLTGLLARAADVPPPPLAWAKKVGPFFGNELATLDLDGRAARLTLERVEHDGSGGARIVPVAQVPLSTSRDRPAGPGAPATPAPAPAAAG